MTYKWPNPHEWLIDRATEAAKIKDSAELMHLFMPLIRYLDADDIQFELTEEMDEDGFFDPIEGGD